MSKAHFSACVSKNKQSLIWISTNNELDVDDRSEFPSLSGAPQPHYQNPGQAVWANANQRATQHTPVQRPQQTQPTAPGSIQTQQQSSQGQDPVQQSLDDAFFQPQFNTSLDDYRHGGQAGIGQLSNSNQPQTTNIDDFPPLGRNGIGEIGQDRRGNLMQNAASGGFPNTSVFSQPTSSLSNHQTDNFSSNNISSRIMSPTASGSGGKQESSSAYELKQLTENKSFQLPGHLERHYGSATTVFPSRTKM